MDGDNVMIKMPINAQNLPANTMKFAHQQQQEATDLLRRENRDSVEKPRPRSSVG